MPKDVAGWQTYNKPYYISKSPFRFTLWCDADCLIVDDLTMLFLAIRSRPLFIRHCACPHYPGHNAEDLFTYLPACSRLAIGEAINAGVIGIDTQRDSLLLSTWCWITERIANDSGLRNLVRWYDEGTLHWVIQRLGLTACISPNIGWNRLVQVCARSAFEAINGIELRPGDTILHFSGSPKPWAYWEENRFD